MNNSCAPTTGDDTSSRIAANLMGRTFYSYRDDFFSCLGLEEPLFRDRFQEAMMAGSLCEDGMHAPVLDIDFPAQLLEVRGGKQELILDISVEEEQVSALTLVAEEVGISHKVSVTNHGSGLLIVLDCPAILIPSETAGHFHLYLEIKLSRSQYEIFLTALFRAGIIEQGFYEMFLRNHKTTVTLPWVKRNEVLPFGY